MKWMEFHREETGSYAVLIYSLEKKQICICPQQYKYVQPPASWGGQWGLSCLQGDQTVEWPVNMDSPNNVLMGKEWGCLAGPHWELSGAGSTKDTFVTWMCDFCHSSHWCWSENDRRAKRWSSQQWVPGFHKCLFSTELGRNRSDTINSA